VQGTAAISAVLEAGRAVGAEQQAVAVGFCRWGTGCVALTSLTRGNSAFNNDTQDPAMKLMDSNWNTQGSPNVATFQSLCHIIQVNGAPFAFYTIPVIVSAGPDGIMGLNLPPSGVAPWDMTPGAGSADNIFSFQLPFFSTAKKGEACPPSPALSGRSTLRGFQYG
jgi:hypothetical protein